MCVCVLVLNDQNICSIRGAMQVALILEHLSYDNLGNVHIHVKLHIYGHFVSNDIALAILCKTILHIIYVYLY